MAMEENRKTGDERPFEESVYEVVRRIPRGRVMTYGLVAECIGRPRAGRAVGNALANCGDAIPPVPWHRVLTSRGRPSVRGAFTGFFEQRERLEREGVAFDESGRCDLDTYEWIPTEGI